jgi:hypothetical protein
MNRALSHVLPALALLPALTGCPQQACTLLYAPDNVVVDVQSDAFAEGEWVVSVGDAACTVTLPGTESDMVCTEGVQQLYLTLSADGTAITEAMLRESAPASLDIEILHDGAVVFSDAVSPTYTEEEPNGEGCGVSRFGTAAISLDG